jgi:hypothetical protein
MSCIFTSMCCICAKVASSYSQKNTTKQHLSRWIWPKSLGCLIVTTLYSNYYVENYENKTVYFLKYKMKSGIIMEFVTSGSCYKILQKNKKVVTKITKYYLVGNIFSHPASCFKYFYSCYSCYKYFTVTVCYSLW